MGVTGGLLGASWGRLGVPGDPWGVPGRVPGGSGGVPGGSLGVLRSPEGFLGGAWGSPGGPRRSLEVPRGLLGGLLGGLEIIEKPLVLLCFQQWGGLGVPCGRCFLFFLISDRIHDRFFDFRSYSRPFLVPGGPWGVPGESLRGSLGDLGWSGGIPGGP